MIGLLKEAWFQITNCSPGVNAWARENVPRNPLHAHDFVLFRFRQVVDLRDVIVRELLNVLKPVTLGIFRNRFVLEHLLQFVILVPAYVAYRGAMFLRDIVDLSGELLPSFFGQRWNGNANELAIIRWIQTK